MLKVEVPKEVKDFVFHHIESVEQLEILLLLSADPAKSWTAVELSNYLRSNSHSVESRLQTLILSGLAAHSDGPRGLVYHFGNDVGKCRELLLQLAEIYKVHRFQILEIIFSPLKRGRDFAKAFEIPAAKDTSKDPSKDPKVGCNG